MATSTILLFSLKIFLIRMVDVSLGTLRMVITVKGKSFLASTIGFFEAAIWFLIVKQAINTNINSPFIVIGYAGGFAFGTYIGGFLAKRLIKGSSSVQVITDHPELVHLLRAKGYGVSQIAVKGKEDVKKDMLIIEVKNHSVQKLKKFIRENDHDAFIVVTDSRLVANGYVK